MFYYIIFNELPLFIVILLHPPRLQAYKGLKVVSPCLKVWQLLHVFFQIKVNTFLLTWVVHIEIRLKLHRDTSHHVTVLEHVIVLPVAPTREQQVVQGFSVSHLTLNQQSRKKIKTAWSAHALGWWNNSPMRKQPPEEEEAEAVNLSRCPWCRCRCCHCCLILWFEVRAKMHSKAMAYLFSVRLHHDWLFWWHLAGGKPSWDNKFLISKCLG